MKEDKRMSFFEHLSELRRCLIEALLGIGVIFSICFYFSEEILNLLQGLLNNKNITFIFLTPAEALWTHLKISLFTAIILALPLILYELWKFVSPGLYEEEKKYALPFILMGIISFFSGVIFSYKIVLVYALNFLLTYKTKGLVPMISIGAYFDFVFKFLLAFGIIFELPLIIILLTRLGILTPEFLSKNRKYAILINFIIAAILTPTPDVFNQTLMAGPLILLYELGIIGARIFRKKKKDETVTC